MQLIAHLIPRRLGAETVLAADSPALPATLQAGDAQGGFGVSAELVLDADETATLSHFAVICRKTVPESDAAYARNHALSLAMLTNDALAQNPARLARGFHLSAAKIAPNTVAGLGVWTQAYVAGPAVWQAVEAAGLTGLEPVPVLQPRTGQPLPGVAQLFTRHALPPAQHDASTGPAFTKWGVLSYRAADLAGHPDFMHTAEPWASARHGWPLWVVSAAVRALFADRRLRGWAFQPVLAVESPLYAAYLPLWESLRQQVDATQHSQLEARDWG